jgi:hypothetical protein
MSPDLRDEDVEKESGLPGPKILYSMNDSLMSNPELREAYTEAEENGLDEIESFEYAYREVFGDEYWEEEMADRVAEQIDDATKGESESVSKLRTTNTPSD